MGEVHRARDTALDRDVAIKALPEDMALDSDCVIRFEREAKAVANVARGNEIRIGHRVARIRFVIEAPPTMS